MVVECKRQIIKNIPWAVESKIKFNLLEKKPKSTFATKESALCNVEHVIAVSSCKGNHYITL